MTIPLSGLITLAQDNVSITLPVNPPTLPISRTRDYNDVEIVNFRTVGRYGNYKLSEIRIEEVFFPAKYDASFCNYGPTGLLKPWEYASILSTWQQLNPPKPVFVHISGALIDTWFAITEFHTEDRPGEPGDLYYTLHLREFIFTSATTFAVGAISRPPSTDAPGAGTFYTIVSGDNLWNIAKTYYGDGSLWPVIWDANAPMTSGNPNLIFPGEVIFIPNI